jgi:ADP-ribose pyrophosphatase YjhB (NUDIX family)
LPGGGIEFKELVPQALIREVKEETSLDVQVDQLLGIFSQQKTPGVVILFSAKIIGGSISPNKTETSDCAFFDLGQLTSMKEEIKPAQWSMVYQVIKNKEFPIFNNFPIPEI